MYREWMDSMPILIGDKEHDRQQLGKAASYYELHGDLKEAKRIRELIRNKY